MKKIAIVGTGTMGMGIAEVFADNGFNVILKSMSNSEKIAIKELEEKLDKKIAKGKLPLEKKEKILNNIKIA